ncbi:hypothetical protein BC828DRAFT_382467 [Blastocladiella britannica]|nr:hypothetical protein BC828DRAFT_382467 [Blastocladiella britannica]
MLVPSMLIDAPPTRPGRRIFPHHTGGGGHGSAPSSSSAASRAAHNPIVPAPPSPRPPRLPPTSSFVRATVPSPAIHTAPAAAGLCSRKPDQWTRVTNNVRNESSDVWQLEPVLGFANVAGRFQHDAAEAERVHRIDERTRKEQFWIARRTHWENMDEQRWDNVRAADEKAASLLDSKRARFQRGHTSVHYDVLSSAYLAGQRGASLSASDAKATVLLNPFPSFSGASSARTIRSKGANSSRWRPRISC